MESINLILEVDGQPNDVKLDMGKVGDHPVYRNDLMWYSSATIGGYTVEARVTRRKDALDKEKARDPVPVLSGSVGDEEGIEW